MTGSTPMTAVCAAALALLASPLDGLAQDAARPDHAAHHDAAASTAPAGPPYSDAEVRRVDKDAQKVLLRHGPIENLGMGEMTMVFRVADPAWLDMLKPGDRIRFRAEKVGGLYTVTAIEGTR